MKDTFEYRFENNVDYLLSGLSVRIKEALIREEEWTEEDFEEYDIESLKGLYNMLISLSDGENRYHNSIEYGYEIIDSFQIETTVSTFPLCVDVWDGYISIRDLESMYESAELDEIEYEKENSAKWDKLFETLTKEELLIKLKNIDYPFNYDK